MSYDQVLLPSGVAATPAAVDAYLIGQQGRPETEAVAAIAAELNRRNAELPEADAFLADGPVGGAQTGAALYVSSDYDAIGHLRALLFELATPREYALYDPQLAWVIDPAGAVPVTVTHGGAGEFPYLTRALVDLWVPELTDPNPYLIVEREPQVYIQTFRDGSGHYTLEYRDGSADKHFGTRLPDAGQVADLVWNWTTGDHSRLDALDWERVQF
ncbi:hypothetical protein [Nocardia terpenica]|uniref:Uncharacterized protein n=1 Tax=Nocardia terpenica TaxID=455432 RepID=A0A164HKM0_9NOCA|nr:hypothetical protein [Nocardia terpenica]ATL65224.1 hypothetical protein CRH09_02235 [Nocardia terpenica]KZM68597.1 hypothetical protein AWN90_12190 [Nocardia terpenica]NQE88424.1 hypothetical protein [Nocardia terpenica]QIS17233.1 hypothetical protein F6W96_01780 [Nocardia terpenica]